MKEVIAVELCDLYVVMQNPKRGTYELRLVNNSDDGLAAAVVPFGEGIAGCVAQTGIAIATSDAHTDSRYNPRYDRGTAVIDSGSYQSRCMLSCPIVTADGAVIGVAQLTNRSDGKPFDDDDMSVMKGRPLCCIPILLQFQLYSETSHQTVSFTLRQLSR